MVLCDLRRGGAEMAAAELVRALNERGHQFTVAALRRRGPMGETFTRAGASVVAGLAKWRFDVMAPVRLARIIRRSDIETIIVVDPHRSALLLGLAAAAISRRRVGRICWCHSMPGAQAGGFVWQLRAARLAGLLDVIVTVSPRQRRRMISCGLRRRRMPVVPNGVDLAKFDGSARTSLAIRRDKTIFVQVANVMPDKDFATLLSATRCLGVRRDDFHLLLVGRGTDGKEMRVAVRRAGLEKLVTLAGDRPDVAGILSAADVFVLSSRSEVFNIAMLEALASGVPVIASDIPQLTDIFRDGVDGLAVPVGDPDALADAMERLITDGNLRSRLATGARTRGRDFSLCRSVERFERLLRAMPAATTGDSTVSGGRRRGNVI